MQKDLNNKQMILLCLTCQVIYIFNKAGEIDLEGISLFQKLRCQEELITFWLGALEKILSGWQNEF